MNQPAGSEPAALRTAGAGGSNAWTPRAGDGVVLPTGDELERLRTLARRRLRSRGVGTPDLPLGPTRRSPEAPGGAGTGTRPGTVGPGGAPAGTSLLEGGTERTLEPRPVIVDPGAWAVLEAGVAQRLRLLEAVADAVYRSSPGDRRHPDGVVGRLLPPEIVYANPTFVAPAVGWEPTGDRRIVLAGFDVRAAPGGGWHLLADHLAAPAGLGRALENRELTTELLPAAYQQARVRRQSPFLATLRQALAELTPPDAAEPRVLMVSPGRGRAGGTDAGIHAELGELARTLGFTMAEGSDLAFRRGQVYLRALAGLEPVHVVFRFVRDRLADPLELTAWSTVGIAGLVAAARRGAVGIANGLGVEWLETPALAPFLPALSEALLGEELQLHGPRTWWCGTPEGLQEATGRLDALVVAPLDPDLATIDGRLLDAAGLDDLRRRITARPWRWTAREPADEPGASSPTLRVFATARRDTVAVLPGGCAFPGPTPAVTADVWVPLPPGGRVAELPLRVSGLGQVDFSESLPSRSGEALFWLGRYAEQAENTLRLARTVLDVVERQPLEELTRNLSPASGPAAHGWLHDLVEAVDRLTGSTLSGATATEAVAAALSDEDRSASLPRTIGNLIATASSVRELVSPELWQPLERLRESMAHLDDPGVVDDLAAVRDELDRMLGSLAAVSGVVWESMVRGPGWHLLDAGRRLERAAALVTLLDATLGGRRPRDVDDELLEALLVAGVSLIAYRRRHRSDLELDAVLAILVLDPSNPRSVRASLAALVHDLAQLPTTSRPGGRDATLGRAREALAYVDRLDPRTLARLASSTEREAGTLETALGRLHTSIEQLSGAIGDEYFRHVWVAQLPTGTLPRNGG